uniref:Uncharacterized protein n=1 Tax=Brassica oleracea TaxID=3712 RepID=A0A3P6EEU0_BRAOL|nr:unnamed protein product [Brassica oleracea]
MPLISILEVREKKPIRLFCYDRRLRDNPEVAALVDKTWKLTKNALSLIVSEDAAKKSLNGAKNPTSTVKKRLWTSKSY